MGTNPTLLILKCNTSAARKKTKTNYFHRVCRNRKDIQQNPPHVSEVHAIFLGEETLVWASADHTI